MNFPYFQFPGLGDGMIIGTNAVIHVIISHGVAIGLAAMVVLAEYLGYRCKRPEWERFARRAIVPTVILVTGAGAITGVGIWFTTNALVPSAIGSMLRVFFWPWFIEWMVFVAEIVVLLVYYFTWDRWQGERKRRHVILGLSYSLLGALSAVLITGILGFMLTSDGWPWGRTFGQAFFNPSFVPQLVWRLAVSLLMGALLAIGYLAIFNLDRVFRREAISVYGKLLVVPLIVAGLSAAWWFAVVPSAFKAHAVYSLSMMNLRGGSFSVVQNPGVLWVSHALMLLVLIAMIAAAWRGRVLASRVLVVPALLVTFFFVAEYERLREFIRGPYLMPGYMYANEILLTEDLLFREEGMLPHAYWYHRAAPQPTLRDEGGFLFARNCGTCHTIGGRNDIITRVGGRTQDGIYVILGRTEEMVPFMPPFSGTDEERAKLAQFLYGLAEGTIQMEAPARFPPPALEGEP